MKDHLQRQIFICGIGLRAPHHLTIETLDALDKCNLIFSILQESDKQYLPRSLQNKFVSLWSLYQPGELRSVSYQKQVNKIIDEAIRNSPIAYLTQGNPVFFDSVTQGIIREGKLNSINVEVLPAISSLDTIFVDLLIDVAPGLQIYEASALMLHNIELRTDVPCMLLQPHVFGTLYVAGENKPMVESLKPLRDYLLKFYDKDHEIASVTSATSRTKKAFIRRYPLGHLGDPQSPLYEIGASLFIPPSTVLKQDTKFLSDMLDLEKMHETYGIDSAG
ncbi:MAG TPA: SAM-dependent methyltransferase [Nitrososphaeraceae archaeon]